MVDTVSLETWLLFVATEGALSLTPGPAVLLVVSHALRYGSGASLRSALGILTANTLYFALSATGLAALLLASEPLFELLRWAGVVYLLYLGIRLLTGRARIMTPADRPEAVPPSRRLFVDGFLLQLANPKALLFFAALLPQFLDTTLPLAPQILVLGATSVLLEFGILAAYGAATDRASSLLRDSRYATATDRLAGILLVGAAVGLGSLRRSG